MRGRKGSVFSKELLGIFNKADQNDDGRSGQAEEEHNLEDTHEDDGELHLLIVTRITHSWAVS